jgi:hypothetical protein
MVNDNFNGRKFGGPGSIVQVDETMMNFKCKSHRGRSPDNRADAIYIVEIRPHNRRIWAEVIKNKTVETILPIILNNVLPNSTIHTDEHMPYKF